MILTSLLYSLPISEKIHAWFLCPFSPSIYFQTSLLWFSFLLVINLSITINHACVNRMQFAPTYHFTSVLCDMRTISVRFGWWTITSSWKGAIYRGADRGNMNPALHPSQVMKKRAKSPGRSLHLDPHLQDLSLVWVHSHSKTHRTRILL